MTQFVTLTGRAVSAPDLSFTQTGRALAKFSIACDRKWESNGKKEKAVSFFVVTAWGSLAENIAASIGKGDALIVEGRLDQRSYETNSGEKRSVVEVTANDVGMSMLWNTVESHRTDREYADAAVTAERNRPADPVYGDDEPF